MQSNLSGTSELLTTQHERMRQHLEDHLKGIIQYMQGMFVNLTEDARGLSNSLKLANEQIQRDTQAIQQRVAESIDQMQKRIESALEDSFVKQERATAASVEKVLEEMGKAVSKTGDSVNQNLTVIDQAMQKEINRVMNEMGNALAQIAGNFTTDYAELVRAMRTIIDQAGQNQ